MHPRSTCSAVVVCACEQVPSPSHVEILPEHGHVCPACTSVLCAHLSCAHACPVCWPLPHVYVHSACVYVCMPALFACLPCSARLLVVLAFVCVCVRPSHSPLPCVYVNARPPYLPLPCVCICLCPPLFSIYCVAQGHAATHLRLIPT